MNSKEVEFELRKFKKKVISLVEEKNMFSIMSNTKWRELQKSVRELPFTPPYVIKYVTDQNEPQPFDKDVWYLGDWSNEVLFPFFNIEWIKVRPRYLKHRGQLISGEIIDETELFVEILNKYSIPYEEQNGAYIIYGHK